MTTLARSHDLRWTPRQREVLDLLVKRYTNGQIADSLGISLAGAKWHVSEIISILGVQSRDEAADYWREYNGLPSRLRRGAATMFAAGAAIRWAAAGLVAVALAGGLVWGALRSLDDESAPASDAVTPNPTLAPTEPLGTSPTVVAAATGAPITAADAAYSLPVTRGDRTLLAAGGYGDRILLATEKPVPYEPGDVIGQGAKAHDQQFWLWEPATDTWELAWWHQAERYESVLAVDGDWVLTLQYRLSPGNQTQLWMHNLATGQQRLIAEENPRAPGLDVIFAWPAVADGKVAFTHVVDGVDGSLQEELVLYDIASGETRPLSAAAKADYPRVVHWLPSIAAGKVAWNVAPNGSPRLEVRDLAAGAANPLTLPGLEHCILLSAGAKIICREADDDGGWAMVDVVTGGQLHIADDPNFLGRAWAHYFAPRVNTGQPWLFDITKGEVRYLEAPGAWRQTARLLQGCYSWFGADPNVPNGGHESETLRFVPLS